MQSIISALCYIICGAFLFWILASYFRRPCYYVVEISYCLDEEGNPDWNYDVWTTKYVECFKDRVTEIRSERPDLKTGKMFVCLGSDDELTQFNVQKSFFYPALSKDGGTAAKE